MIELLGMCTFCIILAIGASTATWGWIILNEIPKAKEEILAEIRKQASK